MMLIGYKLLGNEVLLPMKFLCSNSFRFVDAVGTLIKKLKQASEKKTLNEVPSIAPIYWEKRRKLRSTKCDS